MKMKQMIYSEINDFSRILHRKSNERKMIMKLSKYEFNEKYKRDAKIVVIVPSQGQLVSTDVDQKIEDELRTIGGQLTVVDAGEVYTASLFHYVDIFVKSDFFRSILEGAAYDVLKTSLTALAKSIWA